MGDHRDESYFEERHLIQLKEDAYNLLKKLNGYISYLRHQKEERANTI